PTQASLAEYHGQARIDLGHGDRQLMMVTASVCALLITGVIGWLFLNLIVHLEQSQHRTSIRACPWYSASDA
ncbi:hypothetical protein ACVBEH_33505, partial [Roseateles sp. GG27B]